MKASIRPAYRDRGHKYGLLVEIARQYFEKGKTQAEIGQTLDLTQATVSRLLQRSMEEGVVSHVISPPHSVRIEEELKERLCGKGVRQVKVLPNGEGENTGKNAENLGAGGAEYLWDIFGQIRDEVTIGVSCGETILTLLKQIISHLKQDPRALSELGKTTINLYPLNLVWEPTLQFHNDSRPSTNVFPAALVMYFAIQLYDLGLKVTAHTAQLSTASSRDQRKSNQEKEIEKWAEKSDILILGIGSRQGAKYKRVLKSLGNQRPLKDYTIAGEINYQPFNYEGDFGAIPELIGVTGERLSELAHSEKEIIAVAGGSRKIDSISALLKRNAVPFNVLITDESVSERILAV